MIFHNTMLVLLVCYIIAAIFANIFSCNPAALNFRLSVLGQSKSPPKCVDNNHVTLPLSILHIVFDFALLSVPIIVLYQMQMSVPKKIRICILFSVGAISCIGSLVRQHQQMIKHLDMTCKSCGCPCSPRKSSQPDPFGQISTPMSRNGSSSTCSSPSLPHPSPSLTPSYHHTGEAGPTAISPLLPPSAPVTLLGTDMSEHRSSWTRPQRSTSRTSTR